MIKSKNKIIILTICLIILVSFTPAQGTFKKTIVLKIPGMEEVRVQRNISYKKVEGKSLMMDIYLPSVMEKRKIYPVILFIHGGPIPATMKSPKEWGIFSSYGRLAAASGFIGITFNHRYFGLDKQNLVNSIADIKGVLNWIKKNGAAYRMNPDSLCLWAFSGAGSHLSIPIMDNMRSVKCLVAYYPLMNLKYYMSPEFQGKIAEILKTVTPLNYLGQKEFRIPPILIASAGKDAPPMKKGIREFVLKGLDANIQIDLLTHPEGLHGFDVYNDVERSRDILKRTLQFIKNNLQQPDN